MCHGLNYLNGQIPLGRSQNILIWGEKLFCEVPKDTNTTPQIHRPIHKQTASGADVDFLPGTCNENIKAVMNSINNFQFIVDTAMLPLLH